MGKKKILVEGKHDGIVICELCHQYDIAANKWEKDKQLLPHEISCKSAGSIEKLRRQLPVELRESDLETIGIIVDADVDLLQRWKSICDQLKGSGYKNLPPIPDPQGTIIEEDDLPRLGIWIMPDNQLNGMIEDFAAFLIPHDDELWGHAQNCVEAIEHEKRPFTSHVAKAKIHTWLAWRETPGTPMGSAIKYRYLDANVPQSVLFVQWIKVLFKV